MAGKIKGGTIFFDVQTSNAAKAVNTLKSSFSGLMPVIAGVGAAVTTVGVAIAKLAQESVKAYDKQIEAERILENVMHNIGGYTEENIKSLKDYAKQIQLISTYGDEELLPVMSKFAAMGQLSTEQIEKATKATADLAAFTGRDLRAAQQLVFYAIQGNVGMLKRAGVVLDENIVKSGDINKILEAINEKVGGSAEIMASTWTGAMKQIQNIIGDIKEQFGKMFVTSPGMKKSFDYIRTFFKYLSEFFESKEAQEWVDSLSNSFYNLLTNILPVLTSLSGFAKAMAPIIAYSPGGLAILRMMGMSPKEYLKLIDEEYNAIQKLNEKMQEYVDKQKSYWGQMINGTQEFQNKTKQLNSSFAQTITETDRANISAKEYKKTLDGLAKERYKSPLPVQYGETTAGEHGSIPEISELVTGFDEVQSVIVSLPPAMNPFIANLRLAANEIMKMKDQFAGIAKNMALAVARGEDLGDVLKNALPEIGATAGGALGSLLPGGPGLWSFVGELGGTLLGNLFKDKEINFNQNITINIGEGQISEKAFWDNLVQYYIMPSINRNRMIPALGGNK